MSATVSPNGATVNSVRYYITNFYSYYARLGPEMNHTTVVVMTEFGRRVEENSAFGTDHGRGSVRFVMGGGIKGGRVLGQYGRA